MPCFANIFPVSTLQKLLKSLKLWQSCSQMYTATFYESRQKCRFWFFQVRCTHKSAVVNFTTIACRISSRLKWYKNYKNRLRVAKVIVKNKMSRFLWFTVYIVCHPTTNANFNNSCPIPVILLSECAIQRWFNIPPHLLIVHTLPWETLRPWKSQAH